jgi:hypothetical protein
MHYHLQLQEKAQQPELANTCRSAHAKRTTDKTLEKLLSTKKKQGGNYASNVTSQRTKNIFFSYGATKIFLANTLGTTF